jgi:hypothetical protein
MRRFALIALLATAAGCAAPPSGTGPDGLDDTGAADTAERSPRDGAAGDEGLAQPDNEVRRAAAPREAPPQPSAPEPEPAAQTQAPAPAVPPQWWHDDPVHHGSEVSVCAEAVASELRTARQAAIHAAYAMLEQELGAMAADASIGSEYEATQVGSDWRFRVRVTGSRQ